MQISLYGIVFEDRGTLVAFLGFGITYLPSVDMVMKWYDYASIFLGDSVDEHNDAIFSCAGIRLTWACFFMQELVAFVLFIATEK